MATYNRPDGSTPMKLARALSCIRDQTVSEFTVVVSGDAYEPSEQLYAMCLAILPKAIVINMDKPGERGVLTSKLDLWMNGGVAAVNRGTRELLERGCQWIASIDDDDVWEPDHLFWLLKGIAHKPDAFMVHTQGQYLRDPVFPRLPSDGITTAHVPMSSNVLRSSICVNAAQLQDDVFYRVGSTASDADLHVRIARVAGPDGVVHIPVVTIRHLSEREVPETPSYTRAYICCDDSPSPPGFASIRVDQLEDIDIEAGSMHDVIINPPSSLQHVLNMPWFQRACCNQRRVNEDMGLLYQQHVLFP